MERFLFTLQGNKLAFGLEDRVVWERDKEWEFFLLNPFIILLNLDVQSCLCGTSFGALCSY